MIKKIFIGFLILGTVGVVSYLLKPDATLKAFFSVVNLFTSKPATAAESKPIASFSSIDFITALEKDTTSSKKYMDKNVAISGNVKEVSDQKVILEAGESASVVCTFDSTDFVKLKGNFTNGKTIKLKGIFYGFDKTEDDGMGLIPAEKTAYLKTCFINQ